MSAEELNKQLKEADTDRVNWLEKNEIEDFLSIPEKVQALWDIMWDDFESNNETLQEFKEDIWNICERILENGTITDNQWKILLFYLKHFHNKDDTTGMKIIRTIVYWEQWSLNKYFTLNENTLNNPQINERFNSLPWVQKIQEEKKCKDLLESSILSPEDIKWLNNYKLNNKWNPINYEIEEKIKLEEADMDISQSILSDILNNPLANLDTICPWLTEKKPNRQLIRQNIKTEDTQNIKTESDIDNFIKKVSEVITTKNIWQYLEIPEWTSELDKIYITYNFQNILIRHLLLHPGYKIRYWNEPEKWLATGITIKDMFYDNKFLISAEKKLEELNNKRKGSFDKLRREDREKEIKIILDENNHILFDIRLKSILSSCDKDNIWEIIEEIINYANDKYNSTLNSFSKYNKYIKNIVDTYNTEKGRITEVKNYYDKRISLNIPEDIKFLFKNENGEELTILEIMSKEDFQNSEKFYNEIKWERQNNKVYDAFCNLYESSKTFYESESETIKEYGLPNSINVQDYIDFLKDLNTMNSWIKFVEKLKMNTSPVKYYTKSELKTQLEESKINPEIKEAIISRIGSHLNPQYTKWWFLLCNTFEKGYTIFLVRKFVELWKKSPGKKPDNFLWIKLNWQYCNGNPQDKSDIEKIIRDKSREDASDKVKDLRKNRKSLCLQQVVWDIYWIVGWISATIVASAYTNNSYAAGASYYLWSKYVNWISQAGRDLFVDWLLCKKLWLWEESWNNKYDWARDSFRTWIWQWKRDENWQIINKKSRWERTIDTALGTLTSSLTYWYANKFNISLTTHPLEYGTLDQFIMQPFSNIAAAGLKSSFQTTNYEWINLTEAIYNQYYEEYWPEWQTKKFMNVIATALLVKEFNKYMPSGNNHENISKIDDKLAKINETFKKNGVSDFKKLPLSTLKKFMTKWLDKQTDELFAETQKLWKNTVLPQTIWWWPLSLAFTYLPSNIVLGKKLNMIEEKIGTAKDEKEKNKYLELRNRYYDLYNLGWIGDDQDPNLFNWHQI